MKIMVLSYFMTNRTKLLGNNLVGNKIVGIDLQGYKSELSKR